MCSHVEKKLLHKLSVMVDRLAPGLSEWIAQRVRVLVNFVDPGSIPSGSHFATTHTLATEGVAYHRLFPTQGGFRIRDLPGSLCQARSERACA